MMVNISTLKKEINGAYSPLNDAHYFANQSIEMYRQWFRQTHFLNKSQSSSSGTRTENAQWNIKQNAVIFRMVEKPIIHSQM